MWTKLLNVNAFEVSRNQEKKKGNFDDLKFANEKGLTLLCKLCREWRDMLPFWCSWFKYSFIKLSLVTVEKFCFHFSCALGCIVDYVNVSPCSCVWRLDYGTVP